MKLAQAPARRRFVVVWIVALITLGSGLLNLYSVIGPALPARRHLLREFFPLDFQHLSRSLTLLIGFALVISSVNVYRRKKRAFRAAVVLIAASIVFHLTKGLDYEEAVFSAVLLALLLFSRKHFTVKSGLPNFRDAVVRLAIAILIAFAYGVAGLWFLEPREFGINFTLVDSLHRTLQFLTLTGDPEIIPHTRYAVWFLHSLYMITVTAIAYSGFALFRPVVYRFRTHPHEIAVATEITKTYGRSALDFFKLWPDKSYFFSPSQKCFLAYRVAGNFAVVLGDPVGPEEKIEPTVREFLELCHENDWRVGFHQVLPDFLAMYRRLGFKKLKIGDDAIVDLARFTLLGKAGQSLRNAVNKLEKGGVQCRRYEPPLPDHVLAQLKEVSDEWLQIEGRRERQFTLGLFHPEYLRTTPVFAAVDPSGRMLGFVNEIPSYRRGEASLDLMRRRLDAPNGVMDYLFVKALFHAKEQGYERFNLGMAPMSGFQEKEEASREERAVHAFFQHLNFLFSYKGLRAYKAKFASYWEPRYEIYKNVLELPRLGVALGKVSEIRD